MKNKRYQRARSWRSAILIFSLVNCVMLLASCSDEDYLGGHATTDGAGTLMNVTAQISAQTNPSLAWGEADLIGINAGYGQYDATARNRGYACGGDGRTFTATTGKPIYVKGTTDIVAYYPFVGSDGAEPTLTLDTRDQQNVTDYLFAKAENVTPANGGQVNLVFDYALATLHLAITAPAGEQIRSCRLTGFAQRATVDPYSLDFALDVPEDLVYASDAAIKDLTLKLIPQELDPEAAVPARLVLVGTIRSYSIDLSSLELSGGAAVQANVDVTDGVGSVEFVPVGAQWSNSGVGGSVSSH